MALKAEENINYLLKGCISNNQECIKQIYSKYSNKMYSLCLRYSNNTEEAKDVMQEGFIKAFENIKNYSFKGSFEGWIRRIMINTAIDHVRSKITFNSLIDSSTLKIESNYDDILDTITSKEIVELIQSLSPQYRMVFNLFAIEGYNHKEIAETLGISEGTSKSNYFRARETLQLKLSKYRIEAK